MPSTTKSSPSAEEIQIELEMVRAAASPAELAPTPPIPGPAPKAKGKIAVWLIFIAAFLALWHAFSANRGPRPSSADPSGAHSLFMGGVGTTAAPHLVLLEQHSRLRPGETAS